VDGTVVVVHDGDDVLAVVQLLVVLQDGVYDDGKMAR